MRTLTGVAPVTKRSGKSRRVEMRRACSQRLRTAVYHCSDRIVISWLLDREAVGTYAAGYDLAFKWVTLVLIIVNTAAYPLAVMTYEKRGPEAGREQIAQNGEAIIGLAFFCGLPGNSQPSDRRPADRRAFREGALLVFPWVAAASALAGIKAYYFDYPKSGGSALAGRRYLVDSMRNVEAC